MAAEACLTTPRANKLAIATPTGLIDLSVVIVSWNTRRVIGACLDSVFKHLGVARWLLGTDPRRKARLSAAAARYHLTGKEPAW